MIVQLCGDAHLSNFGVFASPERRLVFDLNDFDETLPGPFEYDVKRMAASFTIAARNNGFSKADARASTLASVRAYREAMAEFAQMRTMDIWYAHLAEDELMAAIRSTVAEDARRRAKAGKARKRTGGKARRRRRRAKGGEARGEDRAKAHTRDSLQALSKLGELVDGQYRIVSQPPIVVPARDLAATYGMSPDEVEPRDPRAVPGLPGDPAGRPAPPAGAVRDRRHGPQGRRRRQRRHPRVHRPAAGPRRSRTRCSCRSRRPPPRCWRTTCPKSRYRQPGERVVQGQRMMQAASDIFLGWTKGVEANRHFYWRQLRDMKGSAMVESMTPSASRSTRASAGGPWPGPTPDPGTRSRSPHTSATSDAFDRSITDFSERYADQNEQDYQAFVERSVRSAGGDRGRLTIR